MSLFVDDNEPTIEVKQEDHNVQLYDAPATNISNSTTEDSEDFEDSDSDDPVIDTIPIHLNDTDLNLLLLQFPNRSSVPHNIESHIRGLNSLKLKPNSGTIEFSLPLATDKFFNEDQSAKWENVTQQVLKGVIIHDEPLQTENDKKINPTDPMSTIKPQPGTVGGSRYFLGVLDDGAQELHLNPILETVQMRPHFKYIDSAKMSKLEKEKVLTKELNKKVDDNNEMSSVAKMNVVTMTAKSSRENMPRLGGALLSNKLEIEEESQDLQFLDQLQYPFDEIKNQLLNKNQNILVSDVSQDEYIDKLLQQTKL